MIGDSNVDILTARACGAQSIGCTFGLSPHTLAAAAPTHLASSPVEWPGLLGFSDESPTVVCTGRIDVTRAL